MILDEGHKIKNTSTKCAKGVHYIKAKHRLILTGTPIQNNMKVCLLLPVYSGLPRHRENTVLHGNLPKT